MTTLGVICVTAAISFTVGWIMAKHDSDISESAFSPLPKYKCCIHCVDPTTGEYTSPHFDEHTISCSEPACFKGNSRV